MHSKIYSLYYYNPAHRLFYMYLVCFDMCDQVLKKIGRYILEQNNSVYIPHGLLLVDPVERGLRVVSLSVVALLYRSRIVSSGRSKGATAPPPKKEWRGDCPSPKNEVLFLTYKKISPFRRSAKFFVLNRSPPVSLIIFLPGQWNILWLLPHIQIFFRLPPQVNFF